MDDLEECRRHGSAGSGTSSSGYTLVEVLLVIVIIAISVGVAIPSFAKSFRGQKLRLSTRAIVMTSRYARNVAVLEQVQASILFDLAKDNLEVVVLQGSGERGGFLEQRTEHRTAKASGDEESLAASSYSVASRLQRDLEDDVQIESVSTNYDDREHDGIFWVNYYPNGMCDAFSVRLRDKRNKTVLIEVDPVSAKSSTEYGS